MLDLPLSNVEISLINTKKKVDCVLTCSYISSYKIYNSLYRKIYKISLFEKGCSE
jgi:hypothetical protein